MRVSVDEYAFGYVKLTSLRQLLMSPQDVAKLQTFNDFDSVIRYIQRFYPNFKVAHNNPQDIESALWKTYFLIIEKILRSVPSLLQNFLRNYILKFEIWNLYTIVLNLIHENLVDLNNYNLYTFPEKILEHEEYFQKWLHSKSKEELIRETQHTPYQKILTDFFQKPEEEQDIFYLIHDLEYYYYTTLMQNVGGFSELEQGVIKTYVQFILDFYNLQLIYRAKYNKVPLEKIKSYIIPFGYFLKEKDIQKLLESDSFSDFYGILRSKFSSNRKYSSLLPLMDTEKPNPWREILREMMNIYYSEVRQQVIGSYELKTIVWTFDLLIQKELEIQEILQRCEQIKLALK